MKPFASLLLIAVVAMFLVDAEECCCPCKLKISGHCTNTHKDTCARAGILVSDAKDTDCHTGEFRCKGIECPASCKAISSSSGIDFGKIFGGSEDSAKKEAPVSLDLGKIINGGSSNDYGEHSKNVNDNGDHDAYP
ncbi:hypothetical protein BC940DRAFT_335819 [Gongronella butleri]|nr:hypothetical protein BC940DRAFT_335819 [Gongronella butleri]